MFLNIANGFGNLFHKTTVATNPISYSNLLTRSRNSISALAPTSNFAVRTANYAKAHENFETKEYAFGLFSDLGSLKKWHKHTWAQRGSTVSGIISDLTCWFPYLQMLGLITNPSTQTFGNLSVFGVRPLAFLGSLRIGKTADVLCVATVVTACGLGAWHLGNKLADPKKPLDPNSEKSMARTASHQAFKVSTLYYSLVFTTLFVNWNKPVSAFIWATGVASAAFGIRAAWLKSQVPEKPPRANNNSVVVDQPQRTVIQSAKHYISTAALTIVDSLAKLRETPDGEDKVYKVIKGTANLLSLIYTTLGRVPHSALAQISESTGAASSVINGYIAFGRLNELNPCNPNAAINVALDPKSDRYKTLDKGTMINWAKVVTAGGYGVNKLCEAAILLRDRSMFQYAADGIYKVAVGSAAPNIGRHLSWLNTAKDHSTTLAASADLFLVKGVDLYYGKNDQIENTLSVVGDIEKIFLSQYKRFIEPVVKPLVPKKHQWMFDFVLPTVGIVTALTLASKLLYKESQIYKDRKKERERLKL